MNSSLRFKMWLRTSLLAESWRSLRTMLRKRRYRGKSREQMFSAIREQNAWGDPDSLSGKGSNLEQTKVVRAELPRLLQQLGARSLLDVPCGDFHWMKTVDLPVEKYVGGDIVPELVERNKQSYSGEGRDFIRVDIVNDQLPACDAIFCRDCLVHLCDDDVRAALRNFRKSGARYLITTTFPATKRNRDILSGEWRPLNLERSPFNLPQPQHRIEEGETETPGYGDKTLGVWRIEDLPL